MAAWEELSRTEYDAVWDRFERRFEFRPSIYESDWPGIREPAPSVTFDISGFYRRDPRASEAMEWDLNLCVLEALRRCTGPSRWLYALDWQHDAYRFYPHRRFEHSDPRAWLVPVLPNGDYYIFLAEGFEFGIFGHPWERTMCVFGPELLGAIGESKPLLFDTVRRSLMSSS